MSDTILGGDFTIYYLDENRQKRIEYTGSGTVHTWVSFFSAVRDHMDELLQLDDGSVFRGAPSLEFVIGTIDTNDTEPWYISYETLQYLKTGALRTTGWTRSVGTNAGIVVVPVTSASNNIVTGDIGLDISHADADAGTLLDILDVGDTNDYLVIRPDSSAAANNFDSTSGNLTCNAHTAPQAAAATTGEQVWANIYSLGTIESDTHIILYQGPFDTDSDVTRVYAIDDQTQDFWSDGHLDICVPIRDWKTASNPIIDNGYFTVLAGEYGDKYDIFEVQTNTTTGGRNPVPLATEPAATSITGYKSITTTAVGTDDFSVGDEIEGGTSGARATITSITGSDPTYTFHYFLIGDPLTDFQTAAETITNNDATGSATKDGNAPSDQGPALSTWFTSNTAPTMTFGNTTADIDDDGTDEGYGMLLDFNANPVTEVIEWIRYVYSRGQTATTNGDGIPAEAFLAPTVYLEYSGSVTGTISEGSDVTQETSGATGVVVSHDTTLKQILLRNVRGTFATHATTHTLTDNDTSGTVEINTAADNFSANKAGILGTVSGGKFFGTRGLRIVDWISADENNFELVDSSGTTRERPTAISITVTSLTGTDETTTTDDRVAVYRLTGSGGTIDKTEYSAAGGEAIGATTLTVDGSITVDTPGKTTGGKLRVRDASDDNKNYSIRYDSWTGSVFTLSNIDIAAADSGTDTDTIVESGAFTNAKRGDLVLNKTRSNAVSYVTEVTDANTVQISPAISGQTTGDAIELNAIPVIINTSDDVYIPLIEQFADSTQASVSIVYSAPIYFRVVCRNVANASPIEPYTSDSSTSGTSVSVAVQRREDEVYE